MKRNLKEAGIDYIEIDVDEEFGLKLVLKYHVMSLPTLVVFGANGNPSSYVGVRPVSELLKLHGLPQETLSAKPAASTGKEQTSGRGEAVSPEKGAK